MQQPHWSESILQHQAGYGAPPTFQAASHPPPPPPPHAPPPPPPPPHVHFGATYSPQPPPPPPRSSMTSHPSSRRTSSFGDGSFLGTNLGVERSCSSGQDAGMGVQPRPPVLGGGEEPVPLSLTKLGQEISRVEFEAQSQIHALILEINRLKKDREISWKHVVELKEQNQLLRDRVREQRDQREPLRGDLEAQNLALVAQNQSMATALNAIQDRLGPLMALASHLQQGGQLPMATAAQQQQPKSHVPHVPHSGADIW